MPVVLKRERLSELSSFPEEVYSRSWWDEICPGLDNIPTVYDIGSSPDEGYIACNQQQIQIHPLLGLPRTNIHSFRILLLEELKSIVLLSPLCLYLPDCVPGASRVHQCFHKYILSLTCLYYCVFVVEAVPGIQPSLNSFDVAFDLSLHKDGVFNLLETFPQPLPPKLFGLWNIGMKKLPLNFYFILFVEDGEKSVDETLNRRDVRIWDIFLTEKLRDSTYTFMLVMES